MAVPGSGPINMKEIWQEINFPGSGSPGNPTDGVVMYGAASDLAESIWRNAIESNLNPTYKPATTPPYNLKSFLGYQHLAVPVAPINLAFSSITQSGWTATWSHPVPGDVDDYDWKIGSGGSLTTTTSTTANVSGQSAGTNYTFYVRASNIVGDSPFTTENVLTLPSAVTQNSINGITSTGLTINWTPLFAQVVSNYEWQVSTNNTFTNIVDNGTASGSSDSASGLASGTLHYTRVRAVNSSGAGSWSNTQQATTIVGAPNITNLNPNNRSVTATWTSVTGATSYEVRAQRGSTFLDSWTNVGNTTSTNWNDLNPNTSYNFFVRAIGSSGTGAQDSDSFTTDAIPAPSNVVASPSVDDSTINWNAVSLTGTGDGNGNYRYSHKPSSVGTWPSDIGTTSTNESFNGLSPDTSYDFRVRYRYSNDDGAGSVGTDGPYTTITYSTTAQPGPVVTITNVSMTGFTVNFPGNGADGYDLTVKRNGITVYTNSYGNVGSVLQGVANLIPDESYVITVQSIIGGIGQGITTVNQTTDDLPGTGKENSFATGPTSAEIGWIHETITGSGNGSRAYEWEVRIQNTAPIVTSGTTALETANPSGLTANTTYEWRLRVKYTANDGAGNEVKYGAWTAWTGQEFTTQQLVLATPVAASATNITPTTFSANWSSVPNATSYQVRVTSTGGTIIYDDVSTTNTTRTMTNGSTGFSRLSSYRYRVRANGTGNYQNSAWSNEISVTMASTFTVNISNPQKANDAFNNKQYNYTIEVTPTMVNTGTYADRLEIYFDLEANASSSCITPFNCSDAFGQAGCYGNNSTLEPGGSSNEYAIATNGGSSFQSGVGANIIVGNFGWPLWLNVQYNNGFGDFGTGAQSVFRLTEVWGNNPGQLAGYYTIDVFSGSGDEAEILITS